MLTTLAFPGINPNWLYYSFIYWFWFVIVLCRILYLCSYKTILELYFFFLKDCKVLVSSCASLKSNYQKFSLSSVLWKSSTKTDTFSFFAYVLKRITQWSHMGLGFLWVFFLTDSISVIQKTYFFLGQV